MAAGGTTVIYGGMVFYNVLVRYFNEEIVYDDSGTDAICQKFTLGIVAHISGLASARTGVQPTQGINDPASDLQQMRFLFAPRQHLEYWMGCGYDGFGNRIGGTLLLISDPANVAGSTQVSLKDVKNGPIAHVLNVTRQAADNLIRIEVDFEVNQLQCTPAGTTGNLSGILNNRWAVVDDIDSNFFTTRTFSGKLRLSSSQVNGNNFRNLCVPPLQAGMRREHMQFAVTEDGLNLLYTVTDREVAFAPPAPATTWSARFTERKSFEGQLGFYVDAEITLGGDRFVDKQKLFAIAASMAESKFQNGIRVFGNDPRYFVQEITLIDEYGDHGSFVHLRATARRIDTNEKAVLGLPSRNLGVPIGPLNEIADVVANYDPRFSRDSRPGENIEVNGPIPLVGAFAAFLQSPCNQPAAIFQGLQGQAPAAPGTTSLPTIVAVINNGIGDDQSITAIYGSANSTGAYTYWHAETHDSVKSNRVQLPVAATGSSGGSFSLGDAFWNGTTPPAGPTAAVIDLAPPTMERKTTAVGQRIGQPPVLPAPQDYTDAAGNSFKVKRYDHSSKNPQPTADGKMLHYAQIDVSWFGLGVITIPNLINGWDAWAINPFPSWNRPTAQVKP